MWEKIKKGFKVALAVLSVISLSVLLALLRRGSSDRRGSTDDIERDRRIKEGLDTASDTARRCEERLQRAEDILREAIKRSRKEE